MIRFNANLAAMLALNAGLGMGPQAAVDVPTRARFKNPRDPAQKQIMLKAEQKRERKRLKHAKGESL